MISRISDIMFAKGHRAAGVRIFYDQEAAPAIDYVVLSKIKNNIRVETTGSCKDFKELIMTLPDSIPLYVSLDGKGIVHKVTDSASEGDELNKVLPNANKNDFIIQKIPIGSKKDFISVMRKEKLEEILNELTALNQFVFDTSLGPVSSFGIIQQKANQEEFHLPHYQIILKEGEIQDIRKTSDATGNVDFTIEQYTLSINYLIPFTSCIAHFRKSDAQVLDFHQINEQRRNFIYKRLFRLSGWVVLLFLFGSLIANILIYQNLRTKNQSLSEQIENGRELLKIIEQKQNLVKTREELISNTSFPRDPLFAYYSDRIAKEVPPEITLNKLELAPQEKSSINKDLFQFINNRILIRGVTVNSESLDSWIKSLKTYDWISEVTITNYFDSNNEVPRFDIEITLKNRAE